MSSNKASQFIAVVLCELLPSRPAQIFLSLNYDYPQKSLAQNVSVLHQLLARSYNNPRAPKLAVLGQSALKWPSSELKLIYRGKIYQTGVWHFRPPKIGPAYSKAIKLLE